jgi:hypothetical protein
MSHAEHFLSRLVRLADDEVKLALSLYYDSLWVREALRSVPLPEGAERVALSLDDCCKGPFLVVTREGQFVTCLARDMDTGQLPIIARDRLDVSARRVGRERQRAVLEERVCQGDEKLRSLMGRLFFEPDSICREDFLEVAAWEPLLGPLFLNTYLAMGIELTSQGQMLRQKRLARRASTKVLHGYWNLLHSTGHLALLGAMTADREAYDALVQQIPQARAAYSYPLTGTGVITFMLKGAWAAGRVGKSMLADYKRALAEDVALFELFDSVLVLLVLGRRSSKLRTEIKKAVLAAPGRATAPEAQLLREQFGREIEAVCKVTAGLLDSSRQELDEMLLGAAENCFDCEVDLVSDEAVRELAFSFPLLSWADGITDGLHFLSSLSLAAAVAELPPETFYLPRESHAQCYRPWEPGHTWTILEPMTRTVASRGPVRRQQPKIGRNAPCPCGSSKKYKRCCGMGAE